MPRIRTVKPEHWDDKNLVLISMQAHLLWIGTWNYSDDKGIIENDPVYIKSKIFPRRTEVRVEQISQWIEQLIKARYMIPFDYKGQGYLISRTFIEHQRIDKPQPSKIPESIWKPAMERLESNPISFQEHSENGNGTIKDGSICIGEDSTVKKTPLPPSVELPFKSPEFKKAWDEWKRYKQQQHKFTFKSLITEETSLKQLTTMGGKDEAKCIAIIEQSIGNGWKGFVELKKSPTDSAKATYTPPKKVLS